MKYSTLLLLLIMSMNLFGQKVVVSTKASKVAYCGLENPIEVLVDGYRNKYFSVKIDSGELKKVDKYNYLIEPTTKGPIHLYVYNSSGRIIYKDSIKVIVSSKPSVVLGRKHGGEISLNEFKAVIIDFDNEDYLGRKGIVQIPFSCWGTDYWMYKVTDYSVRIISTKNDTVSYQVYNNELNSVTKKALESATVGDRVIFESIKAVSKCGFNLSLDSMEFILE